MSPAEGLAAGLRELRLDLDEARQRQLLDYLQLLQKWNQVYNLTAVRDPAEMLTHHLLDSLSVVEPLKRRTGGQGGKLLDVGSGGGLPGVVIAICCPQFHVDCVDTVGKKAAFIQQVAAQLQLPNLRGVHSRVEKLAGPYDVVSSRAFATLADFVNLSRQALAPGGTWLAMKGKRPDAELSALPADVAVLDIEPLQVPQLAAERCVVWMRQASAGA